MASSIQLHTNVLQGCIGSLFSTVEVISYPEICLCVVNHYLQIYLSYSKNCWIFVSFVFGGFSQGISCLLWLINLCGCYICDICMWMIYLWDSHVTYLWDTYVPKLIAKSFKVQATPIFLKTSTSWGITLVVPFIFVYS